MNDSPLQEEHEHVDLSTKYLGLKLETPLVASSCPMCEDIGNVRRMEEAGAAAVVLHSLFEEQIDRKPRTRPLASRAGSRELPRPSPSSPT